MEDRETIREPQLIVSWRNRVGMRRLRSSAEDLPPLDTIAHNEYRHISHKQLSHKVQVFFTCTTLFIYQNDV